MSFNEPGFDQDFGQTPPPRQGMSTAKKLLLIFGLLFGGMMILCCGGVVYIFYYAKGMVSEDPTVIATASAEITEIDIPAEMEPRMSIDFTLPFVGRIMTAAIHSDESSQSVLILGGVGDAFDESDQADMQKKIRQALKEKGVESGDEKDIQFKEIRTIEKTIRGQPATFVISQGTDTESDKEVLQVNGTFEGKSGSAMLLLLVDREAYDEDRVVEIIDSIE